MFHCLLLNESVMGMKGHERYYQTHSVNKTLFYKLTGKPSALEFTKPVDQVCKTVEKVL